MITPKLNISKPQSCNFIETMRKAIALAFYRWITLTFYEYMNDLDLLYPRRRGELH